MMLKRIVMLIVLGLIFSSCDFIHYGKIAIQDIMKRPVNKKIEFEGVTLLIPENTRINPKHGNIVDEKTGYGIAITFTLSPHCMSKKVNGKEYSLFYNSKYNADISRIAKEIIRVNGFKDTCK